MALTNGIGAINTLLESVFGTPKTKTSVSSPFTAQLQTIISQAQRNSTDPAMTDQVVQDILNRAATAFAPVAQQQNTSGLYNSSTQRLLADRAKADAAAASSKAVLDYKSGQDRIAADAAANAARSSMTQEGSSQSQVPSLLLPAIIGGALLYGNKDKLFSALGFGGSEDSAGSGAAGGNGVGSPAAPTNTSSLTPSTYSASETYSMAPTIAGFDINPAGIVGRGLTTGVNTGLTTAANAVAPGAGTALSGLMSALGFAGVPSPGAVVGNAAQSAMERSDRADFVSSLGLDLFSENQAAPSVSPGFNQDLAVQDLQDMISKDDVAAFASERGYGFEPGLGMTTTEPASLASRAGNFGVNAGLTTVSGMATAGIAPVANSILSVLTGFNPFQEIANLVSPVNAVTSPATYGSYSDLAPGLSAAAVDREVTGPFSISDVDLNPLGAVDIASPAAAATAGASVQSGMMDWGANSNSGLAASDSVICTQLFLSGHLNKELYFADALHKQMFLSDRTVKGYHVWGIPYVKLMRKSKLATAFVKPFAVWRAKEVAHILYPSCPTCYAGKLVRLIGEPICWLIGSLLSPGNYLELYSEVK